MKRIRLVFIAVASAVLVLVGLLALRTLTSIRSENEAFHAAVADRAFEGMEEVLFELVRAEEQRPIEHYRAVYVGSEQLGRGYQRSPLTALPAEPFLLGYFQLDAKGRFESPHEGEPSSKQRVGELRVWAERLPEATALQDRAETRGL